MLVVIAYFILRLFLDWDGIYREDSKEFEVPSWELTLTMCAGLAIVLVISYTVQKRVQKLFMRD